MKTQTAEQTRVEELENAPKGCVVLLSGGIDSTVLMYSLIKDYCIWPLTISYGQRHEKEIFAARSVCAARGDWLLTRWKYVNMDILKTLLPSALTGVSEIPEGRYDEASMSQTVVPNRNMILLSLAVGYAEGMGANCVAYAAHSGDHYLYSDCRPEFVESVSETIKLATDGKVRLIEPFIYKTKAEIVALGKTLNVPFKHTYSCYRGGDLHCGRCSTCVERREAFKLAGVEDPTKYANVKVSFHKGG